MTIAFAGDVHFEGPARALLADGRPLTGSLGDTIGKADFAVVNLETALGTGGSPMPGKQFTFEAPPSALRVLSDAGVDAVSMANNHAIDFGDDTFEQTLRAKHESPIPVVGIGSNADEAFAPVVVDLGGLRVAILASSQVRDLTGLHHAAGVDSPGIAANIDPARLRRAVAAAAASNDVVVVVMHWGTEHSVCADERQRQTAADLAHDGADLIVGGHGHRPQGSGWLGSTYVAYGLGNFVWYNDVGANGDSGVLSVTVDGAYASSTTRAANRSGLQARRRSVVTSAAWVPMRIGSDGVPRRVPPARSAAMGQAWAASARCGALASSPNQPH